MALIEHKHELVKAIKAQQYTAAAAVLEKALAVAPGDAVLLEFQVAVQAKLRLDADVSSSDDDEGGSVSACSQDSGSEGACTADDQDQEDGVESADEESSCSASGADDEDDSSSSALTSGTAATVGATADDGSEQGLGMSQLQHALQDMSQQAGGTMPEVSSISLAASSSTLTPQHRLQLRQQLTASISQQKDELVQQQLLKSDPLLAAL